MNPASPEKRKICVITSSRADYGHLFWTLKELDNAPDIDLHLVVMGAHMSPAYGYTLDEIRKDGFSVDSTIECLISSDSDVGMAKTIATGMLGLADYLGALRPDILLVIADRYEMLAPACTALALRIPIAHIEGGDVSEGAIDDAVRNALTKMSHLHFTPSQKSSQRVVAMGEEPWRVHQVGAASLDHLRRSEFLATAALEQALDIDLSVRPVVVSYHPVTLQNDTTSESEALYAALAELDQPIVFCFPNTDTGSQKLIQRSHQFCESHSDAKLFVNLPHLHYWSLLKHADALVGNSSSGIMETPSIGLPTVNVGDRQKGRERADNVIDSPADANILLEKIKAAVSDEFRQSVTNAKNPYGNGFAGEKIREVLSTCPLDETLLVKKNLL